MTPGLAIAILIIVAIALVADAQINDPENYK